MAKVYIGLGSNLANKERNITRAINLIGKKSKILRKSSLYKTDPIGFADQDWFLNCVIKIGTDMLPEGLFSFLKSIEKKLKRENLIKNGPRTIDLDILFYEDKVIKSKNLIIPHPRMHKRLFVLRPFAEISPDFVHPTKKKNIKQLIQKIKSRKKVEKYKQ